MIVADEDGFRRLPGAVAVHRAGQALMLGDVTGTMAHARRALDLVEEDDHVGRGAAAALLGLAHWTGGELADAHRRYAEAMASLEKAGYLSDVVGCAITLADIRIAQGRLGEAMSTYERGLQVATGQAGPALRGSADMHVGLSRLLCERDDLDAVWGGLLDVINAIACIGTAVVLYPVVKRQSEAAALGFVTTRVLEAATIFVGVVSLLSVVTLRHNLAAGAGAEAASLVTTGQALVAIRDWTFLFGPGVMAALNALLLGSLMYRSGLVPRVIPLIGLIGAPLLLASTIATLFGFFDQLSPLAAVLGLPIFVWELSLGVYLIVKGFKRSPITAAMTAGNPPADHHVTV